MLDEIRVVDLSDAAAGAAVASAAARGAGATGAGAAAAGAAATSTWRATRRSMHWASPNSRRTSISVRSPVISSSRRSCW